MPYLRYFRYIIPLQITTTLLSLVVIFLLFFSSLKMDVPSVPPPDLDNSSNDTLTPPPPLPLSNNQTAVGTGTIQNGYIAKNSEGNFLSYQQISVSILVVIGCVVSFLAPYRLKPNYRFCMVWVISIAGLVLGISQFVMIGLRGGCMTEYYRGQQVRCSIQLAVSSIDCVWVILLLTEGGLSYQRSVDKDFQTRLREQEEEGSERWRWSMTSVVYNPDMELAQRQQRFVEEEEADAHTAAAEAREDGGERGDGEGSDVDGGLEEGNIRTARESSIGQQRSASRRLVVQTPIEAEPLPKYKPKPVRGQPRIIDLGNMPASLLSPSTPPPPVSPLEPSSSLSFSPEGRLPSSTTIATSTGGTDSGVPAGTGTTGPGTRSGVTADTISSSLPPSYSA